MLATWNVPQADSCAQTMTWRTLLAGDALSSQLSPAPPCLIWSDQLSNVRCIVYPINDESCLVPHGAQMPADASELTCASRRLAKPV